MRDKTPIPPHTTHPLPPPFLAPSETLCTQVAQQVLSQHGKQVTPEVQRIALGKRPLDCWTEVAALLQLQVSTLLNP